MLPFHCFVRSLIHQFICSLRRINWEFVAVDLPTIHSSLSLEFIGLSHTWRRLTFPGSYPPSIISAEELNFRVRDGNGCVLFAIATRSSPNPIFRVFFLKIAGRSDAPSSKFARALASEQICDASLRIPYL